MPRFFVSKDKISDGRVVISGEDAHHISFSLRMAAGEEIDVCDGEGVQYRCTLSCLDGETVEAQIISACDGEGELPVTVTLYQAYPKGDKLETIIQKSVELGCHRIVPFESERCIKRPKSDKIEKQKQRMNKIAVEAAKQCGRSTLPCVETPLSFEEAISDALNSELAVFCYENCRAKTLRALLEEKGEGIKSVSVIVGCEGGFSEREAEYIESLGAHAVTLGKRILRCETAPLFALSALSYYYEL